MTLSITLDLDDDVTVLIAKVRKAKVASLIKELVNADLRKGLVHMVKPPASRKKFRTTVHSSGRCYLPNLDNTTEVLAIAERREVQVILATRIC